MGHGFPHLIDPLKHRIGHGGQGEKDHRRSSQHKEPGRHGPAVSEYQLHHRRGQEKHACRTGNGNEHVELDGHVDLLPDLLLLSPYPGDDDAGDHGSPQGGGDGNGNVGQKPVLSSVDPQKRQPLALVQALSTHDQSKHGVIHGAAQLIHKLAQDNGSEGQQQKPHDLPVALDGSDLPCDPVIPPFLEHQEGQQQKGCQSPCQGSQGTSRRSIGGWIFALGEAPHKVIGCPDADACMDHLLDHLGDGGGDHVSVSLEIAPEHAHHCKHQDRRSHDPKGQSASRAVEDPGGDPVGPENQEGRHKAS